MHSTHVDSLSAENRHQLHRAAASLAVEFAGTFGLETVERRVADSFEQLVPQATITLYSPLLAQRFARERLQAMVRSQSDAAFAQPSVLFLCVHNSGRSQIASAWLRHLCGDSVTVWSGGTEPSGSISPSVFMAMAEVGIDLSAEFPKPWTDEVVAGADVIITMGCGEACPVLPGKRYEDWSLLHSTGPDLDTARAARDEIRDRVALLAASLRLVVT
jgi:protein-tyrosine-phosphatase